MGITEMLRVLRPDGYLLWTMRTVREEGTTEFGLLDANLRSLDEVEDVKSSRITPLFAQTQRRSVCSTW